MSRNPCKDCVFFKPYNNRVLDRVVVNLTTSLEKLKADVAAHKALPWWKFWKLHPDPHGHEQYYLEESIKIYTAKQKGDCQLNPVHVRVAEDHTCGQFKPKA